MALIKPAIKLLLQFQATHGFSGPALTLGVPEVHASRAELELWVKQFGPADAVVPRDAGTSKNRLGLRYGWVDARAMFNSLGVGDADSLDYGNCEYAPTLLHDLNEPIANEWHNRYGFILDPGTLEHIFDQRTCIESITKALKVGGVVAHLVPIYSYNGGYYSINPNVLWDYYTVNQFDDVCAYILMWDRYRPFSDIKIQCYRYRQDVLGSRHALADCNQVRYTPHLLLFARKGPRVTTIRVPQQFGGDYAVNATALTATREQGLEVAGRRLATRLQAVLPLNWVIYLQTAVYRYLSLLRARRVAGFRI